GTEVVAHVQPDLVVAELLLGDEDAPVAGYVLGAEDGLLRLIDVPLAARLVLAGAAVTGLGADLPAFHPFAVEYGVVSFFPVLRLPLSLVLFLGLDLFLVLHDRLAEIDLDGLAGHEHHLLFGLLLLAVSLPGGDEGVAVRHALLQWRRDEP